jgi:hypothetical protein
MSWMKKQILEYREVVAQTSKEIKFRLNYDECDNNDLVAY